MNNKYIYYPNVDLDMDKLKEIVHRRVHDVPDGLANHQRWVRDEPYLIELQEKYPFLGPMYNIYTTPPEYETPIHICPERGCGLNIPIFYTEDSWTIFYETPTNPELEYIEEKVYDVIISEDVVEVFRYNLDRPTLMNTRIPHKMIGGPRDYRVIMSWSLPNQCLFETAKKLLGG